MNGSMEKYDFMFREGVVLCFLLLVIFVVDVVIPENVTAFDEGDLLMFFIYRT